MFLSREIDIKLCQIYTKIYIYTILYKIVGLNRLYFQFQNFKYIDFRINLTQFYVNFFRQEHEL